MSPVVTLRCDTLRTMRLELISLALPLLACGGGPVANSITLDVAYDASSTPRGCLRVVVAPFAGGPTTLDRPLSSRPASGVMSLAIQRGIGWSADVELTGTLHADASCATGAYARKSVMAKFEEGRAIAATLSLP